MSLLFLPYRQIFPFSYSSTSSSSSSSSSFFSSCDSSSFVLFCWSCTILQNKHDCRLFTRRQILGDSQAPAGSHDTCVLRSQQVWPQPPPALSRSSLSSRSSSSPITLIFYFSLATSVSSGLPSCTKHLILFFLVVVILFIPLHLLLLLLLLTIPSLKPVASGSI
ncbi:hypothetical protein E2C01_069771 [Portunus trituberculatus]|uniref:Uncharacterized protein n=1 Tax=Portunus trituberculatus TaxID=210409 RepID=A0A5B7HZU3_PORTR|nr:hypothetical protein [Portunus trituberculatus]